MEGEEAKKQNKMKYGKKITVPMGVLESEITLSLSGVQGLISCDVGPVKHPYTKSFQIPKAGITYGFCLYLLASTTPIKL